MPDCRIEVHRAGSVVSTATSSSNYPLIISDQSPMTSPPLPLTPRIDSGDLDLTSEECLTLSTPGSVQSTAAYSQGPISRIPPELLLEIFIRCVELEELSSSDVLQVSRSPLLLGQICHLWRNLSLDNPILWTRLTILCPTLDGKESYIDGIKQWLDRSGTLSLAIWCAKLVTFGKRCIFLSSGPTQYFSNVFKKIFALYYILDCVRILFTFLNNVRVAGLAGHQTEPSIQC